MDQISSRGLFNANGSMVLPLEVRNASLALRIASLFEVTSLRGTSSMLSMEWTGRVKLNSSLHLLLSLGIPLKGQMGALHVLIRVSYLGNHGDNLFGLEGSWFVDLCFVFYG